jgi:glycosyltransferase involved in cell wall biosynthesis
MLIENYSFPWDRRMRHLAITLKEAGYQVTVISPKGKDQKDRVYGLYQGISVYRYPTLQARGGVGYLCEYSWAFLCTTFLSLFISIRHGFDIIHSANPPDLFFLLAWPYRLFGKKFVYDQHDVCPELYESKFKRRGAIHRALLALEKGSYHTADLVISTNQSYREIARERGRITDDRSAIVRNGVDITHFYRRISRPELKERFRYMVTYLGVMGKQDGVDRVVQAAHHIVRGFGRKDVLFIMIGKGEMWESLQLLSRELEVNNFMRFVGFIPDDLLLDYLSTSDVCLAPDPPDRMNQLSTMTKIMEYMACERPIVSFDLTETRRSAGDAAVYVEGEDPKLFAEALNELLNDTTRREQMGKVGRYRSIHVVGLDRQRRTLLEAYARMLGLEPPSPPSQVKENEMAGTL